ncbi:MAG: helix-turn-helix domain-containing protein, partial [Candidatus Marsarchaeota archaeon]|nr:helix-turn-helix domain-containing protein [Candidatus Marsarchaeota archaeon]
MLAYIDETLGVLIRYDQEHHGALVKTLETYLDRRCNSQAAAQILFVHINTLHYRLQKISQLTGLDLNNADHCLNLQLALK